MTHWRPGGQTHFHYVRGKGQREGKKNRIRSRIWTARLPVYYLSGVFTGTKALSWCGEARGFAQLQSTRAQQKKETRGGPFHCFRPVPLSRCAAETISGEGVQVGKQYSRKFRTSSCLLLLLGSC
ncbi:hypothetical protein NPIL_334741 [Nephila pilipes]|uniref:Uncharacterized protein n=1 Tax=Nephila pilipes TaxID=299642 RepID=A0A8X6UN87_NEPPI|nr:hypothetical protein NPIL_334741 [Nephila pilipes]